MKRLNKIFVLGFSVMFGLSMAACDREAKNSNSNDSAPTSSVTPSDSSNVTPSDSSSAAHVHSYTESVTKEATCKETGVKTFTCECGDSYTEDIPLVSHTLTHTDAVAATCTQPGNVEYWVCSVCEGYFLDADGVTPTTADAVVVAATGHTLTHTDAVAATCTQPGNVEYWVCSVCGDYFLDAEATTPTTAEAVVVAATGHTLTHIDAVASTCTQPGNVEYWVCSVCGDYFLDAEATTPTTAEAVVVPASHTMEHHDAVAATCTQPGNVEYWVCSVCEGYFLDADGVTPTTADAVVVAASGHTVEEVVLLDAEFVTSSSDTGRTTYYTCSVCGSIFTDATGETLADATAYYWKTTVKDDVTYLVPTNQGKSNSSSTMKFSVVKDCDMTFTYLASSESNYDRLEIKVNDSLLYGDGGSIVNNKSLSGTATGTITLILNADDVVEIYYKKDSSGDRNDDTIYISNVSFVDAVMATVTYVYNDDVTENTTDTVRTGLKPSTIPEVSSRDGYLFDGWFVGDTAFTTSTVVSEDVVVTAHWTVAYTVTVYNNNSEENLPDVLKFRENTVPTLTKPVKDGYMFVGWYTDAELTVAYDTTAALTGPVVVYAKYEVLPAYVGSYKGANIYGTNGTGSKSQNKTATIADDLSVKYGSTARGVLDHTSINAETGEAQMVLNGSAYTIWVFETRGVIIFNDATKNTSRLSNDIDVFFKTTDTVTVTKQVVWSKGLERMVEFTYGETVETLYIDAVNYAIYFDVTVADLSGNDLGIDGVYNASSKVWANGIAISSNGVVVVQLAYKDSNYVALDGAQGTYEGSLGTLVLDGAGVATLGETSGLAYELSGNKVLFVVDGKTLAVTLAEGSYVVSTDGSEGTYTGDYGTLVSAGDGTATLDGIAATYVKEGNKLTLTVNEETKVVVLCDDGTYLTNSIFAGHTFVGSYYNTFDSVTNNLKIVFNEGAEITGTIYAGYGTSYYFNFTATYVDGILTMTITKGIDSASAGKVVVGSVSGSTITITSCGISNGVYSFANDGSVTDSTFNA